MKCKNKLIENSGGVTKVCCEGHKKEELK